MAQSPVVADFRHDDRFLRRVGLPGQIKKGLVHWRAFKAGTGEETLSFTFQDQPLCDPAELDKYRAHFAKVIGGNKPGILWLSFEGLALKLVPPLPPRWDPDLSADPVYGHLHCVTDAPRDKQHMELLAKLVNDGDFGGLLYEFVKATEY